MTQRAEEQGGIGSIEEHGTGLRRTMAVLAIGAIGMAALLALIPAAGHDQLWFLLMAERWLHGAALYGPENFDSNTPAAVWVSAVPAALGTWTGWGGAATGTSLVVLLEAGTAAWSARLLRRQGVRWNASAWWCALFGFVCVFAAAAARDFGQRDQLAAILCLPYVLLAASRRSAGVGERMLAVLAAAAGVCIKPQQALVPLLVEVWCVAHAWRGAASPRPRVRRLLAGWEPWVLGGAGVAFLLAIRRWAPLYFTVALPVLRSTYWAIGHLSLPQLAVEGWPIWLLGVPAVALGASIKGPVRRGVQILLVAGTAAAAAYLVQGTGWYYQQLPAVGFFGSALTLAAAAWIDARRWPIPRWVPTAAAGLVIVALGLTTYASGFRFGTSMFSADRRYGIVSPDPAFFDRLAPGTTVAVLTTSVDDAMMPVARYRLLWGQRTNNLWLLPATLRARDSSEVARRHGVDAGRVAELSALQRRWMVEDLERWRPALVLVARCQDAEVHCQELEDRHDDLLAFFAADPAFRQVWAEYRWVRRSGMYDGYVRRTP